ncbi:MAG: hypothetical protein QXJ75_00205 [Candidatus Bathyarchaeia archaeon]
MIGTQAKSNLSEELTRIGALSLDEIYGESFEPFHYERLIWEDSEARPNSIDWYSKCGAVLSNLQERLSILKPICDGSTVAAVDTSSRNIGWTSKGTIYALRGTITWREGYAYRYLRFGPYLIHVRNTTSNFYDAQSGRVNDYTGPRSELRNYTPVCRAQNFLERRLQHYICRSAKDAIVLFDGCLATVTSSDHSALMEILEQATINRNNTIAISKDTCLSSLHKGITSLSENSQSPCLVDMDGLIESAKPLRLLGRIFVGKLTFGGYGFRIDVDKRLTLREAVEAVSRLAGNDIMAQGYPETLRLAHILSFFTPTEIICLQRFLVKNYGLLPSRTQPLRRMLFGPFGRGENA